MSTVRVVLAGGQLVQAVLVGLAVRLGPVANSSSIVRVGLVALADFAVLVVRAVLIVQIAQVAIAIVHVDLFARTALVAIPTCLAARSVLAATSNYPFVVFGLTVVFFLVKFFLCFVRIFR